MAMTMSRWKLDQLRRQSIEEQWDRAEPWMRHARQTSRIVVAAFNAQVHSRVPHLAWPTFRAMWYAQRYYIGLHCPGCKQESCLDIEKIDWHPEASINSLIGNLKCIRCRPNPPHAVITGLWKRPRGTVLPTRRFRELPADIKRMGRKRHMPP